MSVSVNTGESFVLQVVSDEAYQEYEDDFEVMKESITLQGIIFISLPHIYFILCYFARLNRYFQRSW